MIWKDIPDMYKYAAAIVAATVFVLTYHDQFVTEVEAAERDQQVVDQLVLIRVDMKQEKLDRKIGEKSKAVEVSDTAEAEKIEQEIRNLREQIKSLCDQVEDC